MQYFLMREKHGLSKTNVIPILIVDVCPNCGKVFSKKNEFKKVARNFKNKQVGIKLDPNEPNGLIRDDGKSVTVGLKFISTKVCNHCMSVLDSSPALFFVNEEIKEGLIIEINNFCLSVYFDNNGNWLVAYNEKEGDTFFDVESGGRLASKGEINFSSAMELSMILEKYSTR